MPSPKKYRRVLNEIKTLVTDRPFHYSKKVQSLIENGYFELQDIDHCVRTATRIHKAEVDELGTAVDGRKYTILGTDNQGYPFYTCGKIIAGGDRERLYFFITAHENDTD